MKYLTILFCLLTTVAFAAPVSQGGFEYEPVTRTDVSGTGTETDTVVWIPAPGKIITLMGVVFWSDTKTQVEVESNNVDVIPNFSMHTASGITVIGNGTPIWKGTVDATLTYTTSVSSDHSILLWGFESGR